jgi:hypothetical protein
MPSLEMVKTRQFLKRGVIGQVANDGSVLFTMKYIGSGTVTSVIVTENTDITMITSDGGTDAYTWANYTTVGALVNKINSDGIFQAKVMDALSTTSTGDGLAIDGTLAVDANGNYNIMSDTSNAKILAYRLTYDRTFGTSAKFRNGHRVSLQEIVTDLTLGGGADANGLKIYECTPSSNSAPYAGAETLVWQRTATTGSAETINWASGKGKITANDGNDLLVIVTDAGSVSGSLTIAGELE